MAQDSEVRASARRRLSWSRILRSLVSTPPVVAALTAALLIGTAPLSAGRELPGVGVADVPCEGQAPSPTVESATALGLTLATPDGKTTFFVAAPVLRSWIAIAATADGGCRPTVATATARAAMDEFAPKVARKPRDARFVWGTNGVTRVVAGADGRALDTDATLAAIDEALFGNPAGTPGTPVAPSPTPVAPSPTPVAPSVTLAVTRIAPRLSTAEASEIAPRMRPLDPKGPDGRPGWTTWYEVSERNYWSKNITIPARKLGGYMLLPGDTFSFWKGIGEVSRRTGYGPGGAIINGHSQPTGALAGGICSASTTLFNAAVRAGLRIIERHHHYYYIGRYPVGLDATVSKPRQDMVFVNDTAYPIVIRSSASPGIVHFEIWGVPDGRRTTFYRSAKRNYRRAFDTVVYSSYLRPGVRRRIESPTDGFDVSVTRIVRDRSGNVIRRDVFTSHYARVTGVLAIGTGR